MNTKIDGVRCFELTKIVGIENIQFGENILIDDFALIVAKAVMVIGDHVHISSFCSISSCDRLSIGNFVTLSSGVRIFTASDDFTDHGFGNATVPAKYRNISHGPVVINDFAIIGANAVILPNVVIGQGCSIGAGAIISEELEPWGIYVGHNRHVGYRDRDHVLENHKKYLAEVASE